MKGTYVWWLAGRRVTLHTRYFRFIWPQCVTSTFNPVRVFITFKIRERSINHTVWLKTPSDVEICKLIWWRPEVVRIFLESKNVNKRTTLIRTWKQVWTHFWLQTAKIQFNRQIIFCPARTSVPHSWRSSSVYTIWLSAVGVDFGS